MNKQALVDGLMAKAAEDRPEAVKIFLRLLKQVWEIDWTVAAYDVMSHFLAFDIPYFYRFMALDQGDEAEENQLIIDWVNARLKIKSEMKSDFIAVIDEVNQLRVSVRNS
mgnify:CR=1 FL=1